MKQKLLLVLLLIFSIKTISQNSKFSAELNYISPFDHNFIADNYNGVIDLGIKYRFINSKIINVGVSLNGGILKTNSELNSTYRDFKITSYVIQPKIFSEFNIFKFHPFIGIGYTSMVFNSSSDESIVLFGNGGYNDRYRLNDTRSGIDLNTGIKFDLYKRLFLTIQYDYIILSVDDNQVNSKYNTNVNLIKFGFGFNI